MCVYVLACMCMHMCPQIVLCVCVCVCLCVCLDQGLAQLTDALLGSPKSLRCSGISLMSVAASQGAPSAYFVSFFLFRTKLSYSWPSSYIRQLHGGVSRKPPPEQTNE